MVTTQSNFRQIMTCLCPVTILCISACKLYTSRYRRWQRVHGVGLWRPPLLPPQSSWRDRDAGPKRCHYSQTFRAQSPHNPLYTWCNMLLTGFPFSSPQILSYSPFIPPPPPPPLHAWALGAIIIILQTYTIFFFTTVLLFLYLSVFWIYIDNT